MKKRELAIEVLEVDIPRRESLVTPT